MRASWQPSNGVLVLGAVLALAWFSAAGAADVPASPVDPYTPAGGYSANQGSRIAPRPQQIAQPPAPMPSAPSQAERNALTWANGPQRGVYGEPPGSAGLQPVQPAAHTEPLPLEHPAQALGAVAGLPVGVEPNPLPAASGQISDEASAPRPNPAPAPRRGGGIPLAPPSRDKSSPDAPRATTPTGSIVTVATSLAIVLGLFLLAVWFLRRGLPGGPPQLPSDAVAVLGQLPLTGRQSLHLVRLGGKLILICTNGEDASTLTEITELTEVERIATSCASAQPTSNTATFRDLLTQMSAEPAPAGFLGASNRPARDLVAAYGGQDDE